MNVFVRNWKKGGLVVICVICSLAQYSVYGQGANIEVKSRFEEQYKLTSEEESKKGVVKLPESVKEVLNYKGIPFYEVPSRSFTESEIEFLKSCLDRLPNKFLEMPAKGIVSYGKELRLFSFPTTVAKASGPYIIVGNRLFKNKKLSLNERFSVFMHEYAHVVQYYHLNEGGSVRSMRNHSSLIFDFAVKVGWQVKGSKDSSVMLKGADIPFEDNTMIFWDLPKELEGETTDYGKTNPVEDQAEAFGWVLAGHPERVSDQRVKYVQEFLGESIDRFSQGVIPNHPKSKKVGRMTGNVNSLFRQKGEPQEVEGGAKKELRVMDEDAPVPFDSIVAYYEVETLKRGFEMVKAFEKKALKNKEDYASAVYSHEGIKFLIQVIGFEKAERYFSKPATLIRVLEGVE